MSSKNVQGLFEEEYNRVYDYDRELLIAIKDANVEVFKHIIAIPLRQGFITQQLVCDLCVNVFYLGLTCEAYVTHLSTILERYLIV